MPPGAEVGVGRRQPAGPDPGPVGRAAILFCAHLDTVPLAAPVEPVLIDGAWENANEGILGADNKSAVGDRSSSSRGG